VGGVGGGGGGGGGGGWGGGGGGGWGGGGVGVWLGGWLLYSYLNSALEGDVWVRNTSVSQSRKILFGCQWPDVRT
jgi:hypothetical protein